MEEESPTITLSPPESFKRNADLFDNEKMFPDLDFIIQGLERPLRLHKNVLSQTSMLVEGILKTKQNTEGADENEIKWMFDTSKEVDREALVKVLRFCYGNTVTCGVNNGECCAVIAALYRLQVICAFETAVQISKFAVNQADSNLSVGVELLMATQHYSECTNTHFCSLDKQLAETVLSKDKMQEDHETVVDRCLMKLPVKYLDIASYGDAHTKWSEFTSRARYVRYHSESLSKEEKENIVRKCNWNMLGSDELQEINELGLFEQDTMVAMYRSALEHTEIERNDLSIRAANAERDTEKTKEEDKRTIERLENTLQALRKIICL